MGGSRHDGEESALRGGPWVWMRARLFPSDRRRDFTIILDDRGRERVRRQWQDGVVTLARPLVRPAPRPAMFFPLVVLVAVLPGLSALNSWDLTPPGPWWGLRALAVLDGFGLDQVPAAEAISTTAEASAFRNVTLQPPLHAWLEALGMALSVDRNPLASVLPSYVAGAAVVMLVYLHGRLWRGPGMGLVAAVLVGFNRNLLLPMQQATPTTLALAGLLGALYCYGRQVRGASETSAAGAWDSDGPVLWGVFGGLSLSVSLLSVGFFGFAAVVVVGLHQLFLKWGRPDAATNDRERPRHRPTPRRRLAAWISDPAINGGAVAAIVVGVVAAPWYIWALRTHGFDAIAAMFAPLDVLPPSGGRPDLLSWMIDLAPVTLPLGLFGAARAIRQSLADDTQERGVAGGAFWVLWLGIAALLPAFWPSGPWQLEGLLLLVPLNLLAASAVADLATRRVPVRRLVWIAPATAVTVAWWISASLRDAVGDLAHGRADSATALGVHLALDLLVAAVWITRRLDQWARRRDDRQRSVLGGFLLVVVVLTIAAGAIEIRFRHSETNDLLMLRTMILRRDRQRSFTTVAVIGPEAFRQTTEGPSPGGRLRFILRTALPHLPQHDLANADALLALALADPEGQRLVIVAGSEQMLPRLVKSRLKLEAIHPGRLGVLDAFATANGVDGNRSR